MTDPKDIFVPTKMCTMCGTGYPLNMVEHYFHRDKNAPDTFHAICKTCRAEAAKRRSLEKIGEAAKASKAMQRVMAAVSLGNKRKMAASIADVSDCLMNVFGGASGFAQKVKEEYDASGAGTANRTKILNLVKDVTVKSNELNPDSRGFGDMTDEELKALMVGLMTEASSRTAARESDDDVDDSLADQAVDDDRYLDQ